MFHMILLRNKTGTIGISRLKKFQLHKKILNVKILTDKIVMRSDRYVKFFAPERVVREYSGLSADLFLTVYRKE